MPQDTPESIAPVLSRLATLSAIEILNKALGFLATAHLARALRPEHFGLIGFATAILAYFDLIVDGGLGLYGSRETSRNPSVAGGLAATILKARMAMAVCAFGGLFLLSGFVSESAAAQRTLILYGLTLFTFALFLDWLSYGLHKTAALGIASFASQACFAAGVFFLVGEPSDVIRVPLVQTAAEAVAAILLFYFLKIQVRRPVSQPAAGAWRKLWKEAGPLGLGIAMRTVNYSFDIVLIGLLLEPGITGSYVAAYRLTLLVMAFGGLYAQVLLPAITQALQGAPGSGKSILEQSVRAGGALILPAAAGSALLAPGIFHAVFGAGYEAGITPFRILLLGVVMIVLNVGMRQTLIAVNMERAFLKLSAVSAATNVALNLILVPHFQLEGAAVATVVSEFIFLVWALMVVRSRITRMDFFRPLSKPFLAAALMSAVVYPVREHLYAAIAAGIVCYCILLPALGIVSRQSIRRLLPGAGGQ